MVDINAENVDQVEILVSDKDDFYLGRIHLSLEKLIEPSIYGIKDLFYDGQEGPKSGGIFEMLDDDDQEYLESLEIDVSDMEAAMPVLFDVSNRLLSNVANISYLFTNCHHQRELGGAAYERKAP